MPNLHHYKYYDSVNDAINYLDNNNELISEGDVIFIKCKKKYCFCKCIVINGGRLSKKFMLKKINEIEFRVPDIPIETLKELGYENI